MSAVNMVRPDRLDVDPAKWTPDHLAVIRAAAQDSEVQRVFVNAAIKKALCREATGNRSWLGKIRPFFGHDYHFPVRLACPAGEDVCRDQDPVPPGNAKRLKFPKVTSQGDMPLRPERHMPNSIATLKRRIAAALARALPRCPCCGGGRTKRGRLRPCRHRARPPHRPGCAASRARLVTATARDC